MHAGQHHVGAAGRQSADRGQLFGRPEQAGTLAEGEAEAGNSQCEAHDDTDMQPGDGQQVGQARVTKRRMVGLGDRHRRRRLEA